LKRNVCLLTEFTISDFNNALYPVNLGKKDTDNGEGGKDHQPLYGFS
jgi:hypothetical protein